MTHKSLFLSGFEVLAQTLKDLNMPAYRAGQIYDWIFKKFVFSFDEMTNLSISDREKLKSVYTHILPPSLKTVRSKDGTIKVAISLEDESVIEAVALPTDDSVTFCLSTQVGCNVGCIFCRTGEMGLTRNLTAEEILLQVMMLVKRCGKRPDNIVFMGMGEPLFNRKALFSSIDMLTDHTGLGLASRRITISTSGVPHGITDLTKRPGEVNLAVSLHAADDQTRTRLVPLNQKYPLEVLKEAIGNYCAITGRRVSFEIVLLKGINDQDKDALNLINFCEGLIAHVNIIRFNRFPGSKLEPSPESDEREFRKILKKAGIAVTVRKSRGSDILAACGQLSGSNNG